MRQRVAQETVPVLALVRNDERGQAAAKETLAPLAKQAGGLVCVDSADELSSSRDAALLAALAASAKAEEPTTWVLGVMPGSDLEAQLPVPFRVLKLTSHLALEGAK